VYNVSGQKCVGCALCVDNCPAEAISLEKGIAVIDQAACQECGTCAEVCIQGAIRDIDGAFLMAVGTDDDVHLKLDDHVGNSARFRLFQYADGALSYVETRKNPKFDEDESLQHGDPRKAQSVSAALKGIDALFGFRFGPNLPRLQANFACVAVRTTEINEALAIARRHINEILDNIEQDSDESLVIQ